MTATATPARPTVDAMDGKIAVPVEYLMENVHALHDLVGIYLTQLGEGTIDESDGWRAIAEHAFNMSQAASLLHVS